MPIYEYECSNCKFYVEALQKISEAPLKQCPSCKKQTLKRLVSAPVFRLKGGGWYETDFKSDQEAEAPAEKPADDKAKAEPAKAADKKPAAEPKKAASRKSSARPAAKSKSKPKAKSKAAKRRR
jgi:putative FmdB family regulatory protein